MNKCVFSFSRVISKFTEHAHGAKCYVFCLKNMSTFTQHRVPIRQGEANWKCWPLLNHITGDHISFFIGHKWRTSVSTRLSFHIKHLNRDCSPISVAPLCLLESTCVSYIKPQKEQKGYFVHESIFLKDLITVRS